MERANPYSSEGAWGHGGPLPHHRHVLPSVVRLLPEGRRLRILDVGCGTGHVAGELARLGHEVTGIDFDEGALAIAARAHPDVRFCKHSAETPLRDVARDVDVVLALEVIEHLYSPQSFLAAARDCLRPGGCLILSTPYHGYAKNLAISVLGGWDHKFTVHWEHGHIKFFSDQTLSAMLDQCGFDAIRFRNAGRLPWLWKSIVARARKAPSAEGARPGPPARDPG